MHVPENTPPTLHGVPAPTATATTHESTIHLHETRGQSTGTNVTRTIMRRTKLTFKRSTLK